MQIFFKNNKLSKETISVFFIIAFVSMLTLFGFLAGFNLSVYLLTMLPAVLITLLYPRSGFFAIIFLTFIFERFFTLAPIILGKSEYKIYPLDILLIAIILGIAWQSLQGKINRYLPLYCQTLRQLADGNKNKSSFHSLRLTIKFNFKKTDVFIFSFLTLAGLYGAVSIFAFGNESTLAFSSAKNYAFYGILYFITAFLIQTKEDFYRLGKFVILGAITILGFLAYGILHGEGLWSEFTPLSTDGVRILAFPHAFYLSMTIIFTVVYLLVKRIGKFANLLLILLPFWALGIIGSMMRHLWISLTAAILVVILFLEKRYRKETGGILLKYATIILFITIAIFYATALLPNSALRKNVVSMTGIVSERVVSVADSSDESIFWRSVVWREALKQYQASPVFGVGFGKYISVEIGSYSDFVEIRNMHNSFLVLLVQMGVVGVVLFIAPVWTLTKNIFKKIKIPDDFYVARISVLGILCLQIVAFMFQPYLETNLLGMFFWINLGLMRSLASLDNKNN